MKNKKKMGCIRSRIDYILKHNYLVYSFFNKFVSSVFKFLGCFIPTDKKIILFTGLTRDYNDSPKAIYEYMLNHPEQYGGYTYVWGLENPADTEIPGNPTKIKIDTLSYFIYTLKAKYWISCVNIERSLRYKKSTCKYLNTWHGVPIKHIGNDAGGRKDFNFSTVDYFCYSSKAEKNIYVNAFNVRKEALIPTGLPRNDELYNVGDEEVLAIKKHLGFPLDKQIILYMPTWRDSTNFGASYDLAPPITISKWEAALNSKYIILFRTHAYTTNLLNIEFNDFVRNFSDYPVVNDLFKAADILISDYSASITDFSILEKPILCFAYDYDNYKKTRGLYVNYEELPSGILKTEDEVIKYISCMDYEKECEKVKSLIKERFIEYGGHATESCLKYLFASKTTNNN